jgi:hypothetical protein
MRNTLWFAIGISLLATPAAAWCQVVPYVWNKAGLQMVLPFDPSEAEIRETDEVLNIYAEGLDLEFRLLPGDSTVFLYPKFYPGLIEAVAAALALVIVSSPDTFPLHREGAWVVAKDTILFTDSLLLGALARPKALHLVVVTIDCYDAPLSTAMAVMRSLRFTDRGTRREE